MPSKKLKVGIIGLGNAGFSHFRWFQKNSRAELVSVYTLSDINIQNNFRLRKISFAESPEELIGKVDAVSICSPDKTHFKYIKMAIEMGKHVLVEKPMVVKREELNQLEALVKKSPDLSFATHHQMRIVPTYAKIKKILASDPDFKEIFQLEVNYRHNCRNISGLGWRMKDDQNFLFGAAIHPVDYAWWLLNFEPIKKIELLENHLSWKSYPSATNFSIYFQTESGIIATINANSSMVWPFFTDCQVQADKGTIINNLMYKGNRFKFFHENRIALGGYPLVPLNWLISGLNRLVVRMKGFHYPPITPWEWSKASRTIIDDFVISALDGKKPLVPFESARKTMDLLLTLNEKRRQLG